MPRFLAHFTAVTFAATALLFSTPSLAMGQLADIRLYDRTSGQTLPVHWHQGRAYVVGQPGNEYEIRIKNHGSQKLLAVVSVDGVNVVTGETANPAQSGYVLDAWRNLDIKGWRKDLKRTAAFYFTPLADSYAARTGRPHEVGAVGVALFVSKPVVLPTWPWNEPQLLPKPQGTPHAASGAPDRERQQSAKRDSARAEPNAQAAAGDRILQKEEKLGTGHGRREISPAREVEFERESAHPAEVLTIYYDSYANLLAQGVVREPPVARLPLPRPFPQYFVPDPPGR